MDWRELFPLIVFLIIMVSRTISNFRKEQAKARSRNPQQRSAEPVAEQHPQPSRTDQPAQPFPEWLEDILEKHELPKPEPRKAPQPIEPKPQAPAVERRQPVEERYQPMKVERMVVPNRNPEVPAPEVVQSRMIHAQHAHHGKMPEMQQEQRSPYADIDLEEAVIYSAILNRPEY